MKKIVAIFILVSLKQMVHAQTVVPFLKKNGKYVLVDSATLKPITNTKEFDAGEELLYGFWCIGIKGSGEKKSTSYALFNKQGLALTDFKYDYLYSNTSKNKLIEFGLNEKYGLLDSTGKEIVAAKYDEIDIASLDDMHLVKSNDKYGFINSAGKEVIPCMYEEASGFFDGWALVSKGEHSNGYQLRYYIDKAGKTVLVPKHQKIEGLGTFSEGLAKIRIGILGPKGFIDKTGKIVIKPSFFDVFGFSNGFCQFAVGNDEYGFIDKTGKVVVPAIYNSISPLGKGLFIVKKDGYWGIINQKGRIVLPIKYDYLTRFDSELFWVSEKGIFSIIEKNGKIVSSLKGSYDVAYSNEDGLIMVAINDKYGIVDAREKIIVPLEYGVYGLSVKKFIQAIDSNGKSTFYDKSGRPYAEK